MKQDQHAVLIEVQLTIADLVALTTDVVKPCQKRRELIEILQARDVFVANVLPLLSRHAEIIRVPADRAIFLKRDRVQMRESRAEQDWNKAPLFLS